MLNRCSCSSHKPEVRIDLKQELTRIWQLKMVYIIPSVLSTTGIGASKLHNNWNFFISALVYTVCFNGERSNT